MRRSKSIQIIILSLVILATYSCVHDQMAVNASFHFYQDLVTKHNPFQVQNKRLLQLAPTSPPRDKIRIYADYQQILTGGVAEKNVIKRIVNISANFFYNTLKVDRLDVLKFPQNVQLKCNVLNVNPLYVTAGVIGDLGIIVSNEDNAQIYVARSVACALLKSTNRPIWGIIMFNNRNLGYTQIDFQRTVTVGIHQMTHVLGFSSALYDKYPAGNPFVVVNDYQYLKSTKILKQIQTQYNCTTTLGLPLQDQDGTYNSSHMERKIMGSQFMIAISKKQAYISRLTLSLLDSTGWYDVNYVYAQPSGWGRNETCAFLNVDICSTDQFCPVAAVAQNLQLSCDYDGTAYGSCVLDPLAGSCNIVNSYSNTICIDDAYDTRKLTGSYQANQKGGFNSRCFNSTFKTIGAIPTVKINFRCYPIICSSTGSFFIRILDYALVCRTLGQDIAAPSGMQGTLRCPSWKTYCSENKKTCSYNCNKNGVCINGMCLCTGSTVLTTTCIDQSNLTVSIGNTGGLTRSIVIDRDGQTINLVNTRSNSQKKRLHQVKFRQDNTVVLSTKRSINTKCIQGLFYDQEFGECIKCKQRYGCDQCTKDGCLVCIAKSGGGCQVVYPNGEISARK